MRKLHHINRQSLAAAPLYITAAGKTQLSLDSSKRLCIATNDGKPTRTIPLHLISRITCHCRIPLPQNLILACLNRGIPIILTGSSGATVGWIFGNRRRETSATELLRHALDDPAWKTLFEQWHSLQHASVAAQTLLLCAIPLTPQSTNNPRAALCNAHRQKHGVPVKTHINALTALATQELANALHHHIADTKLLCWYRPGLNLITELGKLISLHAHTDLHHCKHLPPATHSTAWAIKTCESHTAHWQQRISAVLHNFENFLRSHWL